MLEEELLFFFWNQESKSEAREFEENWIGEAKTMNLKPGSIFAKTVESRIEQFISWYDYPISTGPLERTNNKIKVLKRVAYGYRDNNFFILRLLFLYENKIKMVGA